MKKLSLLIITSLSILISGCSMLFPPLKSSYKIEKLDSFVVNDKEIYNAKFRKNPTIGYYSFNGYSWVFFTTYKNHHFTLYEGNIYFGPIINDTFQKTYFYKNKNTLFLSSFNVGPYPIVFFKIVKLKPYKVKITYYFGKLNEKIVEYLLMKENKKLSDEMKNKLITWQINYINKLYSNCSIYKKKNILRNKIYKLYIKYYPIKDNFIKLTNFYKEIQNIQYKDFIKYVEKRINTLQQEIEKKYKLANTYNKILHFKDMYPFYKPKEVNKKINILYNKYVRNKIQKFSDIFILMEYMQTCKNDYCRKISLQRIIEVSVNKDILNKALKNQNDKLINYLLNITNFPLKQSNLNSAVKYSDFKYIKILLNRGLKPTGKTFEYALERGNEKIINYLYTHYEIPVNTKILAIIVNKNMLSLYKNIIKNKSISCDQIEKVAKLNNKKYINLMKKYKFKKIKECIKGLEYYIQDYTNPNFDSICRNNMKALKLLYSKYYNTNIPQKVINIYNKYYQKYLAYVKRKAKESKTYSIGSCYNGAGGARCCRVTIDGENKGHICYKWDSSYNHYKIFPVIGDSKIYENGFYDPNLHMIWTTKCGDSSSGSVYGISSALDKFVNCVANGHY